MTSAPTAFPPIDYHSQDTKHDHPNHILRLRSGLPYLIRIATHDLNGSGYYLQDRGDNQVSLTEATWSDSTLWSQPPDHSFWWYIYETDFYIVDQYGEKVFYCYIIPGSTQGGVCMTTPSNEDSAVNLSSDEGSIITPLNPHPESLWAINLSNRVDSPGNDAMFDSVEARGLNVYTVYSLGDSSWQSGQSQNPYFREWDGGSGPGALWVNMSRSNNFFTFIPVEPEISIANFSNAEDIPIPILNEIISDPPQIVNNSIDKAQKKVLTFTQTNVTTNTSTYLKESSGSITVSVDASGKLLGSKVSMKVSGMAGWKNSETTAITHSTTSTISCQVDLTVPPNSSLTCTPMRCSYSDIDTDVNFLFYYLGQQYYFDPNTPDRPPSGPTLIPSEALFDYIQNSPCFDVSELTVESTISVIGTADPWGHSLHGTGPVRVTSDIGNSLSQIPLRFDITGGSEPSAQVAATTISGEPFTS